MSNHDTFGQPLLTFPELDKSPLSIRAKALVFVDPRSRQLREELELLAPLALPVLIRGETGTGKELLARQIHRASDRGGLFVSVNCGAISPTYADAELFGYSAGAHSGAASSRAGWFGSANGGTLYLDEIADLPLPIQVKLLRVLQEREVVRLGSRKSIPINVRVLAATNVQLEKAINAGHFREDLYYRLNVVTLQLHPLRDRPGDILPLARHFIRSYSDRLGYGPVELSPKAQAKLVEYSWPGNIRELENVIHHSLLTCGDGTIQAQDLRLSNLRIERQEEEPAGNGVEDLLQRAFSRLYEEQSGDLYEKVENALPVSYTHLTLPTSLRV